MTTFSNEHQGKIQNVISILHCSQEESINLLLGNEWDEELTIQNYFENNSPKTNVLIPESQTKKKKKKKKFKIGKRECRNPKSQELFNFLYKKNTIDCWKIVKEMQDQSIQLDPFCFFLVFCTVAHNLLRMMLKCIKNPKELDILNEANETLLMSAYNHKNIKMFGALLEFGVDPNFHSERTASLYDIIKNDGDQDFLKILEKRVSHQKQKKKVEDSYKNKPQNKEKEDPKGGIVVTTRNQNGLNTFLQSNSQLSKATIRKQYSKKKKSPLNPYQNTQQQKHNSHRQLLNDLLLKDNLNSIPVKKLFKLIISNQYKNEVFNLFNKHQGVENLEDSYGNSLIHHCVYYSNEYVAKLLLQQNIDLGAKGSENMTPIQLANFFLHIRLYVLFCLYLINNGKVLNDLRGGNPIIKIINNKIKTCYEMKNIKQFNEKFSNYLKKYPILQFWIDANKDIIIKPVIKNTKHFLIYDGKYQNKLVYIKQSKKIINKENFQNTYLTFFRFLNNYPNQKYFEHIYGYFLEPVGNEISMNGQVNLCLVKDKHNQDEMYSLRRIISQCQVKRKKIDPATILFIMERVCYSLELLNNSIGFAHQSISCDSIKIKNDGYVKITNLFDLGEHYYSRVFGSLLTPIENENTNARSFGVILAELLLNKTLESEFKDDINPKFQKQKTNFKTIINILNGYNFKKNDNKDEFKILLGLKKLALILMNDKTLPGRVNFLSIQNQLAKIGKSVNNQNLIQNAHRNLIKLLNTLFQNDINPKKIIMEYGYPITFNLKPQSAFQLTIDQYIALFENYKIKKKPIESLLFQFLTIFKHLSGRINTNQEKLIKNFHKYLIINGYNYEENVFKKKNVNIQSIINQLKKMLDHNSN
ncbi:ankyrin repeat-containing protein [Anaeramoeba flamelloides]|uniref:Ankyrin repeat-containing protein n=1 Tax=Anaeramoeba flamelloides TaxID=1746091 RepID=A0AAV7ZQ60_9EUKA|nr:ankyrin repeat-containing protein [Anaeramoeba flamelloides]